MITLLQLALALAVAGVVGFYLLELLIRRPTYGAVLVLASAVVEIALVRNKPALFVGSAKINVADLVFVLVIAAAVARLLRAGRLSWPQRLLVGLGALAVFSLLRGIPQFGVETAVNEFRGYMRFIGGALYMSTYPLNPRGRERTGWAWIIACVAVAFVAMLRWLDSFVGLPLGPVAADYGTIIRSISGVETYFLATGFLVSAIVWRRAGWDTRSRWISGFLAVMVVTLNRRTVWVALLAGLAVMVLRDRVLGRRLAALALAAVTLATVALIALPGAISGDEELAKGATDTGNLAWRIEGWSGLLESRPTEIVEQAAGQPFGTGFAREVSNRTLESNPHSFYLETLLRLGAAGLACLLAVYVIVIRGLLRMRSSSRGTFLGVDTLLVIAVSQCVWYVTWAPGFEQGLLLGMAIAATTYRSAWSPADEDPVSAEAASRAHEARLLLPG